MTCRLGPFSSSPDMVWLWWSFLVLVWWGWWLFIVVIVVFGLYTSGRNTTLYRMVPFKERIQCTKWFGFTGPRESVNVGICCSQTCRWNYRPPTSGKISRILVPAAYPEIFGTDSGIISGTIFGKLQEQMLHYFRHTSWTNAGSPIRHNLATTTFIYIRHHIRS